MEEQGDRKRPRHGDREQPQPQPQPLLIFAHGAGASSSSEWMIRWKELLKAGTNAVEVVTFDYPYLAGGKRGAPPKAEKLVDFHLEQVNEAAKNYPGHPLILLGKSMGSRVSCMVASKQKDRVAAVVCLGYPLKGTKGDLREQPLLDLEVPVMFVQGSKDAFCPLEKLEEVMKKMSVRTVLHTVEGGDHSFKVPKRALKSSTQKDIEQEAVDAIGQFLLSNAAG